jgi:TPP-dependent trihydroxycyclohexane-1,2-dione (THcHDO) dehydratase
MEKLNLKKWAEFNDLFSSIIDNSSLSNIDKFQHLKNSLEGDASRAISHLLMMEGNYKTAYELIKKTLQQQKAYYQRVFGHDHKSTNGTVCRTNSRDS